MAAAPVADPEAPPVARLAGADPDPAKGKWGFGFVMLPNTPYAQ